MREHLIAGYPGGVDDAIHPVEVGIEEEQRWIVHAVLGRNIRRTSLLAWLFVLLLLLLRFLLLFRRDRRGIVEVREGVRWIHGVVIHELRIDFGG